MEKVNLSVGVNGQIYGEHTKSGKHYIYAHKIPSTKEIFYIGLGKYNRCNQILQRNKYWKHIYNKHGLEIEILHNNLTLDSAKNIERQYIKKLQPRANVTIGGEAGMNEGLRKKVYCYLKNGNFFKSFDSITEANIFFDTKENDSRITRCLQEKRKSFKNLIWTEIHREQMLPYKKSPVHNIKAVYRYDLQGNFICKLNKITDFKEGSRSGISLCLDKNYTFFGSFWRSYFKEKIDAPIVIPALKLASSVKDLKTGIIYKSIREAAKSLSCCDSVLQRKLSGKRKNNTTYILI